MSIQESTDTAWIQGDGEQAKDHRTRLNNRRNNEISKGDSNNHIIFEPTNSRPMS